LWKTLWKEDDRDPTNSEFDEHQAAATVIMGSKPQTHEEAMGLLETLIEHVQFKGDAQETTALLALFPLLCAALKYEPTIFYEPATFAKIFPDADV
jgi:hypothetical protein